MTKKIQKIRQSLIQETNYKGYLVFAIGEILLIVIGIVIALQIDNWNQKREHRGIVTDYYQIICTNIQADIKQLEIFIDERAKALIYTDTILNYYKKQHISDQKLFERGFFSIIIETKFNPDKSAFESLINSGYMRIIKNSEVEEQLHSYYNLIENVNFVETKFANMIQPVETILTENGFFIEFKDSFFWENQDTIDFTYQKMMKYPEVESTFIRAKMFLEELLDNYYEISNEGYEVIELLNNGG